MPAHPRVGFGGEDRTDIIVIENTIALDPLPGEDTLGGCFQVFLVLQIGIESESPLLFAQDRFRQMAVHRLAQQVFGLVEAHLLPGGNGKSQLHQVEIQERHPLLHRVGHRHPVFGEQVVVDHLAGKLGVVDLVESA